MLVCAKELLGEEVAYALQKISLFNDTVKRRQDEMVESLEEHLVEKLKVLKCSLQIDETINNSALLLAYVRYIDGMAIHEEMLFMMTLTNIRSETICAAVYDYLHKKEIPLSNLLQIASDDANVMTGKHNRFIVKLKKLPLIYWRFTALFIDNILQLKL